MGFGSGGMGNDEVHTPDARLRWAAINNDVPAIERALKEGAAIDTRLSTGATPLHNAAYLGHTDAVIALLEAGAQVNAPNDFLLTPLYIAAAEGATETANILLAADADITLKTARNYTPADIAQERGHEQLANQLQSIMNDPIVYKRPTPESVGLDMAKRNAALKALGKPVGKHTQAVTGREAQRRAALELGEGI